MSISINEQIISGIEKGVDKHWRYTKDLYHVKPEYLLTVSVADALTNGFDQICGIDLEIKLEEPTSVISADLLMNAVGLSNYFTTTKHKINRKGKVDIYVKHDSESWIIELKGFNPSATDIKKEIIRLLEFLSVNQYSNKCNGCYIAFPTSTDKKTWIEKQIAWANTQQQFKLSVISQLVETNENPEDGIPCYYANCICIFTNKIQHTSIKSV